VKVLLGLQEVNPSKPDNDGKTPLSYAAWFGHEGVVKILLGRQEVKQEVKQEVNLDKPDNDGRTLLLYAALKGYREVVKMLLRRQEIAPEAR